MVDEKIIRLFFERSEQAIAETDNKYGQNCHRLSFNILHNRQDAEECVNDSYLGLWNAIPPHTPDPLSAFLYKIVRNLSIKRYEKIRAKKRNSLYEQALEELEPYLVSDSSPDDEIAAKELARTVEAFLDTLDIQNRVIFLRRYWFADSYGAIAGRVGLTEKNVSVRLTRLRRQLKAFLTERGILN